MMLLIIGCFITTVWGCSFNCQGCRDGSQMGVCIPRGGGGFNCMSSRSYVNSCASWVPRPGRDYMRSIVPEREYMRSVVPERSESGCTRQCFPCGGGRDSGVCIKSSSGYNCMSGSSYKRSCEALVPSRSSMVPSRGMGESLIAPSRYSTQCTFLCSPCNDGSSDGVCIQAGNSFNCNSASSYKRQCAAVVPSRGDYFSRSGFSVAAARQTNQCTFLCSPCKDGSSDGVCIQAGNSFNCYSGSSYMRQCAAVVPSRGVEDGVNVKGFGHYKELIIGGSMASAFCLTFAAIWKLRSKKPENDYIEA